MSKPSQHIKNSYSQKKKKKSAEQSTKQQELPPPLTTPGLLKRFSKNDTFKKETMHKHHRHLIIDHRFSPRKKSD